MAKVRRIPRGDPDVRIGVWRPVTVDGKPTAKVSCPDCGSRANLTDHVIDSNGYPDASLECTHPGCSFHERVHLEGWP